MTEPPLTSLQVRILLECARRTGELRRPDSVDAGLRGASRTAAAAERAARLRECERGPEYSSRAWLGAVTAAERTAASRAVKALEAAGLVAGTGGPTGRLTHLRLTGEGEKIAAGLSRRKKA